MEGATVAAGLLRPIVEAIRSIEGKKPVSLAVRLSRLVAGLEE